MRAATPDGLDALAHLRRHGDHATSFQTLEDGTRLFALPEQKGFVGYVDTGACWVAAGAPVCAPHERAMAADRFRDAAARAGRRACFFAAEPSFADATTWTRLHIGEQPTWDPSSWSSKVAATSSLRAQLNRARNKGVVVRRVDASELGAGQPLRVQVEEIVQAWLAARPMAPMGFLVDVQPFLHADERRFFVACRGDVVVAFLSAVPIYARAGWLLEDLLRTAEAPAGTAVVLIDAAMTTLSSEGARVVTLGMAPLSGDVPRGLREARELLTPLYDFAGLHAFKRRLAPDGWEPLYLLAPTTTECWRGLLDALRAFARGRLRWFALQSFLRGPPAALWALAALLSVWTALLAVAPSTWFPATWVQTAWVAFDVALTGGIVSLARRHRRGLGLGLAVAVSVDAVVTFVEAAWFHLPHLQGPGELVATLVACAGPVVGASALWGLHRTRRDVDAAGR
jgi:phosphatidylglycerol lysyltransferase